MRTLLMTIAALAAFALPAFAEDTVVNDPLPERAVPEQPIEPPAFQATLKTGEKITIEKAAEKLKLKKNERVVLIGVASQGCGFTAVETFAENGKPIGNIRYVDTALFNAKQIADAAKISGPTRLIAKNE